MAGKRIAAAHRGLALVVVLLSLGLLGTPSARSAPDPSCVDVDSPPPPCPDLVIVGTPRSTLGQDRRTVVIVARVANEGNLSSGAASIQVERRGWPPLTASLPALDPRGPASVRLELPIPPSAFGGIATFLLTIDSSKVVPEQNEDNNRRLTRIRIPPAADLTLADLRPGISADGTQVVLTAVVENTGTAEASATTAEAVARGWSGTIVAVPALAPQQSATVELPLVIPDDARGRVVVPTVTVDPGDAVFEANEANNSGATKAFVPTSFPDLVVIAEGARYDAGTDKVLIDARVANVGVLVARPTTVRAAARGWETRTENVPQLAPKSSIGLALSLSVPDAARGRAPRITLTVDPQGTIRESREDNNKATTEVAIPAPKPDLTVAIGGFEQGGDTLVIHARVANGGGPAPATRVEASAPGFTPTSAFVPPLAGGVTKTVPVSLRIPDGARGQSVSFALRIDPRGTVDELREDNNGAERTIAIANRKPDLTVAIAGLDQRGDRLDVRARVKNAGGPAPGARVQVTASGFQTRSEVVPELAAGGEKLVTVPLVIPDSERGKRAVFTVAVDPSQTVSELREDNNTDEASVEVEIAVVEEPRRPDLTIEIVRAEQRGGRLEVETRVTNAGAGASRATAVAASVPGVGAIAVEVRRLEPGGSAAVPLSLDVGEREPLQARLTVTVDPGDAVEEEGEGNNSDARTVTVGTPTRRPDLTVAIDSTAQRGDRLELSIRVANNGDRRASATRADVSALGFETVEQEVRALAPGGETVVAAALQIPEGERGRDVVVAATVDPLGAVEEQDEGNNRSLRTVAIAATKRPDLNVSVAALDQTQGSLDLETRVANRGNGSAPATDVEITAPGLDKATAFVPPLGPGDTVALSLTLGVPASERGEELPVVATVDPANRVAELREDNNRGETRVAIEKAGPATWLGRPVWPFWSVVIVVAGVALVVGIGIRPSIRIARHQRWRSEARDEEPPDECRHCTRYTRKVELELKPARRKIAHLELQARDDDGRERTRELKGKIVEELNRAVRRHRRKRPNEDLRRALDPVALGIVAEVEEWLADETVDADVSIEAHIVGGKVECTFTVYHCIHGEWEEEDEWSEELEDERDERVAELPFPLVSRAEAYERLLGQLTEFVTRVDVEAERPPEAMPLPQG